MVWSCEHGTVNLSDSQSVCKLANDQFLVLCHKVRRRCIAYSVFAKGGVSSPLGTGVQVLL